MSNDRWLSVPSGRRLDPPDFDPAYVGSIGVLRRADEARLRLARKYAREIPEKDIEGDGKHLVDRTNGEQFEAVVSFVDWVDLKASGVVAFVIRDSLLVPLRPAGWVSDADTSHYVGEFSGRRAEPKDPMPMPVGPIW